MKSTVKTIIVIVLFGLLTASSTLAQENPGETTTTGIDSLQPAAAVSLPSKEPPPPVPPPSQSGPAYFTPAGDNSGIELEELFKTPMIDFVEPIKTNYISLQPGTPTRSSKVLVIPSTEIKTEEVVAITRDMQVMSHIFDKIFKGPRLIEGVFVDYGDFFGRGSRATQAIYLQGFGTLFVMEVDFPFSPPDESKDKPEDTKEGDSVWNQAAQEMFFPTATTTGTGVSAERYDAEKVEELKSRLIKALKHTANIRNLKSDEWIVLTVIGKGGSSRSSYGSSYPISSYGRSNRRDYSSTGRGRYSSTRIVPGGVSVASSTVLTIRAKKSDVDTFAKGDLDYEEFREKVQILTYSSLDQTAGRRMFIQGTEPPLSPPPPPSGSVAPEPTKDAQF